MSTCRGGPPEDLATIRCACSKKCSGLGRVNIRELFFGRVFNDRETFFSRVLKSIYDLHKSITCGGVARGFGDSGRDDNKKTQCLSALEIRGRFGNNAKDIPRPKVGSGDVRRNLRDFFEINHARTYSR